MFSKIYSGGLQGIEGYKVQVEADVGDGLPGFSMVGYLAAEVREAEDRVRTAIKNSGFSLPPMKVTLNLSPANIRKDGSAFDLPIALAILGAYHYVDLSGLENSVFIGELGLDGRIKGVTGVLALVVSLRDQGIQRFFLSEDNVNEGLAIDQVEIIPVKNLSHIVSLMDNRELLVPLRHLEDAENRDIPDYSIDFAEISGQATVRRATEIAVAGRHNILYVGPPGSGKSMIASRIPTIMPPMDLTEQLELSKIYSVCGLLPAGKGLMKIRPFRNPHHTISPQALIGGGRNPRPGEVSLASRGVLFLDELTEYKCIEVLREPLEEHRITVSRLQGTCTYPADFMLVAAMNPCSCGYYPDRSRCTCNELQIRRYLNRISRPLLDRIDICVEAAPVTYQELRMKHMNESSKQIRERVMKAQRIQRLRFEGTSVLFNSEMGNAEVKQFCALGKEEEALLKKMFSKLQLSARSCNRILKVARTIADLEDSIEIQEKHLSEAFGYRALEEQYWGKG